MNVQILSSLDHTVGLFCESDHVTNPVFVSFFERRQKNYITYSRILGVFAKFRKVTVSFVISVRLSERTEQLSSHRTDFHKI
jgi:hypothetical protein